jgi:hypothetical protein
LRTTAALASVVDFIMHETVDNRVAAQEPGIVFCLQPVMRGHQACFGLYLPAFYEFARPAAKALRLLLLPLTAPATLRMPFRIKE